MKRLDKQRLQELIRDNSFEQAARSINDRYRATSSAILAVFEEFMKTLTSATFRGDLKDLGSLLNISRHSPRSLLRSFISDKRIQNCLTAVLHNLEKNIPSSVRLGFRSVSDYFHGSDFVSTYLTDVVNYEAEFSQLTDNRLVRLLSQSSNIIDISRFDARPAEKKRQVLETYQQESLEPIRSIFLITLTKCEEFFSLLDEYADNFRNFYQEIRKQHFALDADVAAEWLSLGDEYFQIELIKSSLMLPISPKALYWGMQKEYPETLKRLKELKEMVTPDFTVSDAKAAGDCWSICIECRNPDSLKGESFTIDATQRYDTEDMAAEEVCRVMLHTKEPHKRYEFRVDSSSPGKDPLLINLKITCEARYYNNTFMMEKSFELKKDVP